jgi:hypothetical protein
VSRDEFVTVVTVVTVVAGRSAGNPRPA